MSKLVVTLEDADLVELTDLEAVDAAHEAVARENPDTVELGQALEARAQVHPIPDPIPYNYSQLSQLGTNLP